MQLVKVTLPFSGYNPGERCGFALEMAESLRQRNLVCFIDQDGNVTKMNDGQRRAEAQAEATRRTKRVQQNARHLESTRRFFNHVAGTENLISKVVKFIEEQDEPGLVEYSLSMGFVGITIDRFEAVTQENKAVRERNQAAHVARVTSKPAPAPQREEKPTAAEKPKAKSKPAAKSKPKPRTAPKD